MVSTPTLERIHHLLHQDDLSAMPDSYFYYTFNGLEIASTCWSPEA